MESSRAPAPLLTQAHATLQLTQPHISSLGHVVSLISQYLDPSPRLSLAAAASSSSIRLFDRVACRLLNDQQLHGAVRDHAFARAMEAAIEKDDSIMVKRIHELHPEPVVFKTLQAAIKYGSLEMVQWLVEHRHDRLCCPPGVDNLCFECLKGSVQDIGRQDACRVVQWLHERGYSPAPDSGMAWLEIVIALSSSVDLVKWFGDTGRLTQDLASTILENAVSGGKAQELQVIKYLVGLGVVPDEDALRQFMVEASLQNGTEEAIEYVIKSGLCDSFRHEFLYAPHRPRGKKFIQWDPDRLDLPQHTNYSPTVQGLRWLYDHFPDTEARVSDVKDAEEEEVLGLYKWLHANNLGSWSTDDMNNAAKRGFLRVVQWLHANRSEGCTVFAMDEAAASGHLHVVQWLHANRSEGCTYNAVNCAAANGHIDVAQWLLTNRHESDTTTAMAAAATSGQVETLAGLYGSRRDGCTRCVLQVLLRSPFHLSRRSSENVPVLNSLWWLRDHQPASSCLGECMDHPQAGLTSLFGHAIGASDLQLLDHLYSSHREFEFHDIQHPEFTHTYLAHVCHLSVIQWVRERYVDEFDWRHVRDAAHRRGKHMLVAWLDEFAAGSQPA